MAREIVLDTETTGFDPKTGDRLIEVGCIEIDDLLPTGRTFHRLVNPERLIPPDAIRVHGITDDKVRGAPKFMEMADDLLEFIGDAPVIAHNAAFDRAFINHELGLCGRLLVEEVRWIDTLGLAQTRFPGMANSLDAPCRVRSASEILNRLHRASSELAMPGKRFWASCRVSIQRVSSIRAWPHRPHSWSMKLRSNWALCAITGASPMKPIRSCTTSWNFSASRTLSSVMPWTRIASGGISRSGLTRV